MGPTYVTVTVRNLADRERSWDGLFRVDPGVADSIVPRGRLEAIGIEPWGSRAGDLPGGTARRLGVGGAAFEFMGDRTACNVVFGDDHAEPVLGRIALASVGIEVDPESGRLRRRTLRLKRLAAA